MSEYQKDPFFQVPRTIRATSEGDVEFPILYYDVSTLIALFFVEYDRAAAKLADMALRPALTYGKKAVAALAFFEYRKTSIGPYNEVGLAIPALPPHLPRPLSTWLDLYSRLDTRRVGFHILDLPVTSRAAWSAGREVWGYPKFVTEIPFQLGDAAFHGEVTDPDRHSPIVTLSGKLGWGMPAPPLSMVLYSCLDGRKLRAVVNVRGSVRARRAGGLRLCIGDSEHIMAKNLRDLGLHDQQPFLVMDTHRFQSRLNLGEEIFLPES